MGSASQLVVNYPPDKPVAHITFFYLSFFKKQPKQTLSSLLSLWYFYLPENVARYREIQKIRQYLKEGTTVAYHLRSWTDLPRTGTGLNPAVMFGVLILMSTSFSSPWIIWFRQYKKTVMRTIDWPRKLQLSLAEDLYNAGESRWIKRGLCLV